MLYRMEYTPYTPSGHRDVKLPVRYDVYVVNVDGTGLTRLTHTEALEEKVIAWVGGEEGVDREALRGGVRETGLRLPFGAVRDATFGGGRAIR